MNITSNSIDVVTVTYGNRWEYLREVIKRVLSFNEVNSITVIDNSSSYDVEGKVKGEFGDSEVKVFTSTINLGSAGGFKWGIEEALNENGKLIWLLDDDNLPKKHSLQALRNAQKNINTTKEYVLCSFREDWTEMLSKGGNKFHSNSFFEFSIINKLFKKFSVNKIINNENSFLKCEYAPYGGLLFPKTLLKEVGLPNENFYLYVDDTDFTYRMTKKGYGIFCIIDSKITDLESSWFRVKKEPMFLSIFNALDPYRGLINIRNRTYFEVENNSSDSMYIYYLNMFIYLIYVFIFYMPKNSNGLKRYFSILKAIKQGFKGTLGNEIQ
jgi:GT2 family glycosyltransferase